MNAPTAPLPPAPLDGLRQRFSGRLLTEDVDTAPFLTDWRKRYTGRALAVAQPDTAADVAAIVRWCAEHRVPLVPQGGNTGMVGGATPDASGSALVLSLARMNRIRDIDTVNNTATVEAGVILANLQQAARDAGRLFPLSLAAEGSCTVGGNLSTNAGGVQVLRYGNTRELCLGLEVVTPAGEVWNGLRGLRKDNTGYDLKDLFIGAEGTLGVITAATMKLYPLPAAQVTALAAVPDPHAALRLLMLAQQRLAASLTAFELISDYCMGLVERHLPANRRPLAEASPYYVLLESSDFESEAHARERFEALLGEAMESGEVTDAAIAGSIAQSRAFWAIREGIPEAQALEGRNIKHDISVPISSIGRFIDETNAAIERDFPGVRLVVFGHLGDGNLHYNVSPAPGVSPEAFLAHESAINHITYEAVAAHRGSISAEHGLGQLKPDENVHYKSPLEIGLMRSIKAALDPQGIMNPGKVLPA
ncbi:FAD-binding oxidoreductase [Quisquiliibacterium transsilvanicum]|uniref:FAD/FMN-containing dehydrogenase n=1 Tax=Quisquiliibacterium transsilvanicum TaxID=1549638 RepID=A0A7W8M8U2_9BURK|nr:FAD-binding oxidoreductase [Quisquiliibacterium transsilvanicum]MBB5271645.1 FAD/FMN-containing dehydrogenase [Quisquiliibacterium transsilvanicum]